MTDTPLPFPRRGLNDNWAYGQQPSETATDAQNVRSVDPTTGRTRGAQRAGMSKHKAQVVGSTRPVRLIRSATYEAKTITYEALQGINEGGSFDDAEQEWSAQTEAMTSVVNLETDLSGNVYALTGNTVEKRNPDGVLLWSFAVPLDNPSFTLGPLVVDTDLSIYVAVDGGATLATGAAVYKIDQIPVANTADTEPAMGWTGAWVFDRWIRELRIHQGSLKCLVQDDTAYRSHVATLGNISLQIPAYQGQIEVPYPSTCMVIKSDGSAVTGHPYFADRDSSPKNPGVGVSLESWVSSDIDDYENRIWSSFRAQDLVDNGVEDGQDVGLWPDRSGNNRNLTTGLFPSKSTGPGAPTLRVAGSTGLPSVYFDGTQGLFSAAGGGTDAQREACKTMVPNNGDGAYCIVVVCRPSSQKTPEEKDESGASIDAARWLFQQFTHTDWQGDSAGAFDKGYTEAHRSGIVINASAPTATGDYHYSWSGQGNGQKSALGKLHAPGYLHAFTPSSGYINSFSTSNGLGANGDVDLMPTHKGAAWAGWPYAGQYDDPTSTDPGEGLCVVTFMNCGGLDEALAVTGDFDIGVDFTAAEGTFDRYPIGATGVIWVGSDSDTVTVASDTELTLGTGNIATGSDVAAHIVWERNWMTRSQLTINGQPIDRWEALPMAYAGADDTGGAPAYSAALNLNVEHNPTGLGYPIDKSTNLLGFLGEIMEIEVFGRRQRNEDRVTIDGTPHVLYPSVLDHPMYAANGHSADTEGDDAGSTDKAWYDVGTNIGSSELEKIVGEKMHRHGIASRLPAHGETYAHPHYPDSGTTVTTYDIPILSNVLNTGQAWVPRKRSAAALIVKHDLSGRMLWCLNSEGIYSTGYGDIFTNDIHGNTSGTGITDARPTAGLALDSNEDIYVVGPGAVTTPADTEAFCMGILTDSPQSSSNPSIVTTGFWKHTGADPSDDFKLELASDVTIRCKVDAFDNFYVPIHPGTLSGAATAKDAFRAYGRDDVADEYEPLISLITLGGSSTYQNGYGVALPPSSPPYVVGTDFATNGIQRAEFAYVGLEDDDNSTTSKADALGKWSIVGATTLADSQGRERKLLALSGGVVYEYTTDWVAFDGVGDPSLSADAHYFWGLNYRQKTYIGDGRRQVVYDPKLGTLESWASGTSGTLPEKCALAVVYHARIVMARAEGQPQNWYMSAAGDPNNWDFYPPTQSATQAIFGNNTAAEQCPDIINTLIPHNDDYLIFGCDHSIWLLRGDPVDAGQFDEVSSTIGMAFGKSWTKDPTGLLYFFGSKGGVYRMAGDSAPQHLSDARDGQDTSIQDRLRDIDLAAFRVELVWDFERQGLIVLQLPYDETITEASKAWFWDVKNNAWWEDLPGAKTLQPYSAFVVDGDAADDRRVVYGCEDGFVRELDSAAFDDDGTAISSSVTIGPIAAGRDAETVLNRLRAIFASEQFGCSYTVFASDTPSELGTSVASGYFEPGLGQRLSVNRRGSFIWVKLESNVIGQRWALEELEADVVLSGLRRARG